MNSRRAALRKPRLAKQPAKALIYADFLPKPARATPRPGSRSLSFERWYGSHGGHSAWDPPQPTEALIKNVFKDPEFRKDFSPNDPIDRATADYCIGNEVGSRAAKEFARHVKKVRDDEHVSFLSKIAMSMLGQPSDDRRRGEVIGFFSELEEILHKAMRRKREVAPSHTAGIRQYRRKESA